MTTKPMLLLAALTLFCCIASLQAFQGQGCKCIQTISTPMPVRVIKKIEVIPISGHCRQTEIIVTRKNNSKVCVNPEATWINLLITNLRNTEEKGENATSASPTKS